MKDYILELTPKRKGFLRTPGNWEKHFPEVKKKNRYTYTVSCSESELKKYKEKAHSLRIATNAYKSWYARSSNYRAQFLALHPAKNGKYRCWYCGRKTRNITVDHIIPVKKAQTEQSVRMRLAFKGIEDVNDPRNLALACERCNKRKSAKTGVRWSIKACLGKNEAYWMFRTLVIIVLLSAGLFCLIRFCMEDETATRMAAQGLSFIKELKDNFVR